MSPFVDKTKELTDASSKMAERLYAQGQTEQQTSQQQGEAGQQDQGTGKKDENVVDAEFEEVKDEDKREGG